MHRDIARYVAFLTIVRLITIAACPAPCPWTRHHRPSTPASPAMFRSPQDARLYRDVMSRRTPRPTISTRLRSTGRDDSLTPDQPPRLVLAARERDLDPAVGAAVPAAWNSLRLRSPDCDITPPVGPSPPPQRQATAAGQSQPSTGRTTVGRNLDRAAGAAPPAARSSRRLGAADCDVTAVPGRPPRAPPSAAGRCGADTGESGRGPGESERGPDRTDCTAAPPAQRRRPTHRGTRSYQRKRGPRRHRRDWTTNTGSRNIKICALNIQSLKPKTAELYSEMMRYNYDFVVLSETWLKPCTPNRLLNFPGYVMKRADRTWPPKGYGGVALIYRDRFECKPITVPGAGNVASKLESLWCQLKWENNRVIVASLYRPPRHTAAALEAYFDTLEQQFQHVLVNFPDCPIVFAGDLTLARTGGGVGAPPEVFRG